MTPRLCLAATALAILSSSSSVCAQATGVAALLAQATYWQSKGRQELATQAYQRVLAVDPGNAAARRGLANRTSAAAPSTALLNKPQTVARPPVQPLALAPRAEPKPTAATPSFPPPPDSAGDSRAAGFKSLADNNLDAAARHFRRALSLRPGDTDALGGMGIVRLRQDQFADARDYLTRASAHGGGAKWAEALASARFYAALSEARVAKAAGRIDAAQKIAEDLSSSASPQRGPALELLASIYEAKGHFAEAAALYQTAAKLGGTGRTSDGNERRATRALAMQAAAAHNDTEAEQLFQRGMVENTGDPWIRYDYARFLAQRGRRSEVLSIIAALPQLEGAEPLYAAALLSGQIGRDAAAEALMRRIPEAQMTDEMRGFTAGLKIEAVVAQGKTLAARGERAEAIAALDQIARMPGLTMAKQAQVAAGLLQLGEKSRATALAQRALDLGSVNADDFEGVVRVLTQTGQDDLAAAAVRKAASAAGTLGGGDRVVARLNGIVVAAQADRMRESGEYAAAFDLLQGAWQASPGALDVLAALARLYQSGGLVPQAVKTFQLVLKDAPTDKGALIGLVDTAGRAGDYALARQALDRAVRLDPNDYAVYLAAARMERSRGNEGAALRHLKRARDLYLQQTQVSDGGFASDNPFAASPDDASSLDRAPVNPFDLGRSSARATRPGLQRTAFAEPDRDTASLGSLPRADRQTRGDEQPRRRAMTGDTVLQSIDDDLDSLAAGSEPRADIKAEYRQRSGETGLSQSQTVSGKAELSAGLAGGRLSASAAALAIDAGRPTGSGLARFGRNATAEAQAIVAATPSPLAGVDSQRASGVAVSLGYSNGSVKADVGSTPIGFGRTGIVGGLTVTPRLSSSVSARIWAERRAVEDSVVAYAGSRDPVSGDFWGAVRRAGGGASVSYDVAGTGGYVDGSYYTYRAKNVRRNRGLQVNVGGYTRFYKDDVSALSIGINANYQDFANDQNYFTFGHGGYFSPKNFLSLSFPAHYSLRHPGGIEVGVDVSPGYQSYSQAAAPVYPTDAAAQAELDLLKAIDNDVRSRFDSLSQTGFGLSAGGSVYYPLNARMKIGGSANYNTFGAYNEFRGSVGIKQVLGGK